MKDEILNVRKVAKILERLEAETVLLGENNQFMGYKLGQKTFYSFSDLVCYIKGKESELRDNANSEWTEITKKYANDEWQ